jgi:apolipoprotein N-acyltransferase
MRMSVHVRKCASWFWNNPGTHFVCAGVLMGIAFLHPFLWWTGVLGFALLAHAVRTLDAAGQAFWYGTLAGTLKMLLVLVWFWTVYPVDWIDTFSPTLQILGIGWVWFSASVVIGISIGCLSSVLCKLRHARGYFYIVPFALVVSEILGSILFSLFEYGPGGSVNAHFSFGYLGYTLGGHGVLGMFSYGTGVYSLSLLGGVCASFLAYSVARQEYRTVKLLLVTFLFIITYFVPPFFTGDSGGYTVATVNTQFENHRIESGEMKAERTQALVDAFKAAIDSGSDVIVFPETAGALKVFGTADNIFDFVGTRTDRPMQIVDSGRVYNREGNAEIRATIYDSKKKETEERYKSYLVPSGEFLPYHLGFGMSLFGFRETGESLDAYMAYVPRRDEESDIPSSYPGILFCSESLSPIGVLAARTTHPLVVHPVSHAWFNTPKTLWYQLDLMLKTQTRMARIPLVQASNMSEPKAYDRFGNSVVGETVFSTASTSVVVYEM